MEARQRVFKWKLSRNIQEKGIHELRDLEASKRK
jgi:hypothetical protein